MVSALFFGLKKASRAFALKVCACDEVRFVLLLGRHLDVHVLRYDSQMTFDEHARCNGLALRAAKTRIGEVPGFALAMIRC